MAEMSFINFINIFNDQNYSRQLTSKAAILFFISVSLPTITAPVKTAEIN